MKKSELKNYINRLQEKRTNPVLIINTLLQNGTYNDMEEFKKMLPKIFQGLLKLPYLCRKSYKTVYTTGYHIHKETPEEYLDIMLFIIRQNAELIKQYVQFREQLEYDVLQGEYESAISLIHTINETLSYSMWAAIAEVKLARLSGGLSACNEKTEQLLSLLWTSRGLLYWAYKTSSIDIPFSKDVDDYYNEMLNDGNELYTNFMLAHCFPYIDYKDGPWLSIDFKSSIIDLYNQFFYLVPRLVKQIEVSQDLRVHLCELSQLIKDPILVKYCKLFKRDRNINDTERESIESFYLSDQLEIAMPLAQNYLKAHPKDFQIMDLWVKCLIRSNKPVPNIIDEETLFGKIVSFYYQYLRYGGNHNLYYTRLVNIYRALLPFVCFKQLGVMVEARHQEDIYHIYDNYWIYSSTMSFTDASFYNVEERTSLTDYYNISDTDIDFNKLLFVNSIISYDRILFFEDGLKKDLYPPYVKGMLSSDIIKHYLVANQLSEAIRFYVEQKLKDPDVIIKLDLGLIEEKLEGDGEKELGIPLYMSIFHTLTNANSSKRKIAYRRYLRQVGVKRASELKVNASDSILIYFLSVVVDTDIISLDALYFKSTDEVLEERLKICENLYVATDDKRYYNEIVQLDNERTIKGMSKTLDESKIFVDTEAILEREMDDIQDLYGLYAHTGETVKTLEFDESLFELKESLMSALVELRAQGIEPQISILKDGGSFQEVEYKNSLFKQFFLNVRNRFLLDPKYGLDYHLSTRIRHGFIANQIRTNFQNQHLVTNKGADGEYIYDSYWTKNVFMCNEDIMVKCQKRLAAFSKYVDGIIAEVKDELIQVKTESVNVSKHTCLDYSSQLMAKNIRMVQRECGTRSFESAVSLVFDNLWLFTEDNLQIMRNCLDLISKNFLAQIDILEYDILALINNGKGAKEFKTAITDSKTHFLTDFQIISQWFNRQNDLVSEFKLDLSLQTCIGTINKINQYKIEPNLSVSSNKTYKGKYLTHFNDLFHNLLNNVLTYNKRKSRNGKCDISIKEDGDWLDIHVSNAIESEDVEEVSKATKIDQKEIDEKLTSGGSRKEGHSGIVKIYNIVHNVFGHSENSYENEVADNMLFVNIRVNTKQLEQNNEDINC